MTELVTDEMVEAGSRAMSMAAHGIPDGYNDYTRDRVHAVLEAVAPLIAARAQLDLLADLLGKGLSNVEYTVSRYPIRAVPQALLLEYRNRISRGMKEAPRG